jgi:WD40 repeat protein
VSQSVKSRSTWRVEVDDAVVALAASPDGRVAVAGAEGSITVLSADGAVQRRQALSPGCLTVAWSPSGDRIAVGSIDGVRILDSEATVIGGHGGGWCSAVAWSFDGARLAAGIGRTAVVMDAGGVELVRCPRESTVTGVAWIKSRLATAAYGGVHVQHVSRTAAPDVLPFTGSLLAMAISPDKRWAASGNQDATLHVWRVGKHDQELAMSGYPTKITALGFSPDSSLLASGGGPDVTVWDFTGRGPRGSTPRILRAHQEAVTAIAWSADGALLASAAADGQVAVWTPRLAEPGHAMAPTDSLSREAPAEAVCWDPSGRLLAGWADATVIAHVPEGT